MTDKYFWIDPYCSTHETTVTAVSGDAVQVASTILFVESGGQESDAGSIAGHTVIRGEWRERDLVYWLAPDHGLVVGQPVRLAIDWDRRYALMRLHFAAEVVLESVYRLRPQVAKTGAHISASRARIDFALDENLNALLPEVAVQTRSLIERDLPIESGFSDRAQERRYWAVEGFAQVPCGGTHLKRTGEVGAIALKRRNVGRGLERVEITLAPRA